jgi:hypothetical protein
MTPAFLSAIALHDHRHPVTTTGNRHSPALDLDSGWRNRSAGHGPWQKPRPLAPALYGGVLRPAVLAHQVWQLGQANEDPGSRTADMHGIRCLGEPGEAPTEPADLDTLSAAADHQRRL